MIEYFLFVILCNIKLTNTCRFKYGSLLLLYLCDGRPVFWNVVAIPIRTLISFVESGIRLVPFYVDMALFVGNGIRHVDLVATIALCQTGERQLVNFLALVWRSVR